MSSRGYLVDLIESIGEKINLCSHINEQLRGCEDEQEKAELKEILKQALLLRRQEMSRLLEDAEHPNPLYHCSVKHALGSFLKDVEVYEATLNEKDLEMATQSANLFAMVLSKYLGMEFEKCARCVFDRLLVEQVEKERSAIMKEKHKGDISNG